jgi:CRP-like cAMP-binding protein
MDILRGIPFLQKLTDEERQQLAAVAQIKNFPAGSIIFQEGENVQQVFLVGDGLVGLEVHVSEHGGKRIHTAGPGELIGWSPLLGKCHMTATARTLAPVWLVAFDVKDALAVGQSNPTIAFTLMREAAEALASRFHTARRHVANDSSCQESAYFASMHEGAD